MSRLRLLTALIALLGGVACKQMPPQAPASLANTSWQLVKFQGGDDTVRTPDDKSKYTLSFATDRYSVRFDCNRGNGAWKSTGPNQLEFGPMAMTRAMCPPDSMHDQLVKHWPYIRSYVLKNGKLFLSLQADGGIYELEPLDLKN